ncbi:MAG TPA: phage tail protein [Acidimicrobiales bacterium]|jgi:phage tail-like protein|nr:phage tail protein [Acidimicrobiales bacterium]
MPQFLNGDSAVGHYFGLEIDGTMLKDIMEITNISFEQDVVELKQNTADGKFSIIKMPGRYKAGNFTVTRGYTADSVLEKWHQESLKGSMKMARKGGAIIVFDYTGLATSRFKFTNAWCSKIELGPFKAGDTSPMTEKGTVEYETLEPSP